MVSQTAKWCQLSLTLIFFVQFISVQSSPSASLPMHKMMLLPDDTAAESGNHTDSIGSIRINDNGSSVSDGESLDEIVAVISTTPTTRKRNKNSSSSAETAEQVTSLSHEHNASKSVASEFVTSIPSLSSTPLQILLMSSNFPTTIMSNVASDVAATTDALRQHNFSAPTNNAETRLRWVDFRRHQAYPPLMPAVPGIPSGFRNPIATITSTTSPPPTNPMYNGFDHHSYFADSSSNAVSLGSVIMEDEGDSIPFKVPNPNRRYNITRVEHIAAECSDEYMKVVIRFNGTFTGLIYSSGYVHDPNCIYVNGSGRNHYEFFIRLNQCGTLGRQEMFHPTKPGEARRRDQLMWNTLSIQYNAMIEEEFDEHFRLTCEYGSDFWKTVTFPSVNVEINTGSPVVFTINPPQCQMEIRRGFGIAGSRTSGPVTVGDPLTLIIHMKSEKAGFDILVKNCIAHNGAQQRMQLIDTNGCVTNDKLISPFRGTYNSENGHQVSLYSYLKAFRFTGSPALYLECDIHMCHNRCPPQRCYWRNLSKRSAKSDEFESKLNITSKPIVSESISLFQALEVHHEQDEKSLATLSKASQLDDNLVCLRSGGLTLIIAAFVCLMSVSIGTSICYCLRMRRVKHFQRNLLYGARHHFGSEFSVAHSSSALSSSHSDCSVLTAAHHKHRQASAGFPRWR